MADTTLGNGRVSLRDHIADLMSANDRANAQRFEAIKIQLDGIENDIKSHGERIRECELRESANAERWKAHEKEHVRETKNQHIFAGVLSGILSTFTGIVSSLVGVLVSKP